MKDQGEMSIEDRLIYNNNKLVADKIRKTLLNIQNVPGISAKRWIWELIQNAKDVENKFGKVDIKIELNQNCLKFSHNGSYFSIDNVLGILQQVSSKDSNNLEDQTGKFGTGFIGTHLLSYKVKIKGIVKYKGIYKKFEINLDRSAKTSEQLLKEVSKSILEFKKNMENKKNSKYVIIQTYKQKQEDFDTIFEYNLEKDENREIAKEGLSDLINTAPITLANQYKKISSILIIDNINKEETKYYISSPPKSQNPRLNTITISSKNQEKKIYFYSYENENCRLLFQVEKKSNGYFAVEREKDQPILYRDFPLIGSENFHFPFFLDGFKLNPLETRNGLYLNGNLNEEAEENRKIIESAIKASIEFTKWLLKQNIDKRYILANTKIPEPPQKYDDFAINWFIEQQKQWRKEIIEMELLTDQELSLHQTKKLKIPTFKKEFNETFFNLFEKINITDGIIPNKNDAKTWHDIMEKDPLKEVYDIKENTWGFNYKFTEDDLFQKINNYESIFKFADDMAKDTGEIYKWLNNLYEFLSNNNCKDCFNKFNIIPNKNGNFKKIHEIFGDDENNNKIHDIIYKIYKEVFDKDLNEIIVNEKININIFEKNLEKKNVKNILDEFSDYFKGESNIKKEYLCNELLSFEFSNQKIKQMSIFRDDINFQYKNKRIKDLMNYYPQHNIWRDVEDYWFDYHSKIIESKENINNLKELFTDDVNKQNPLAWLNKYLMFLKENSTNLKKKKNIS